mmetsp:Transcript_12423/g.18632  ORF Transcript_12423/g.18632 Transcript_12423/m.18632 type:complete len:109 (-) Transcript_12423:70-396(-)
MESYVRPSSSAASFPGLAVGDGASQLRPAFSLSDIMFFACASKIRDAVGNGAAERIKDVVSAVVASVAVRTFALLPRRNMYTSNIYMPPLLECKYLLITNNELSVVAM